LHTILLIRLLGEGGRERFAAGLKFQTFPAASAARKLAPSLRQAVLADNARKVIFFLLPDDVRQLAEYK